MRSRIHVAAMVTLLGAALVAAPSMAGTRSVLTPAGDLLVVEEVVPRPGAASLALRSTLYREAERPLISLVPGTADRHVDASPWLTLDPDTGNALLVWSRREGTDFDIYLARHDGRRWSAPVLLVSTPGDDLRPRAYPAAAEGLHLVWTWPEDGQAFFYGLFRADTTIPVLGPERIEPQRDFRGGRLPAGSFTEGGCDDSGLNPACVCEGRFRDTCQNQDPPKLCVSPSGPYCVESAATPVAGVSPCGALSVVTRHRERSCILERGPEGWQVLSCLPGDGPVVEQLLRQAVDGAAGVACGD